MKNRSIFAAVLRAALVAALSFLSSFSFADKIDEEYASALSCFRAKQWQEAADRFSDFQADHPLSLKAKEGSFYRAESLTQLRRIEEARIFFQEYLKREPCGRFSRAAQFRLSEGAYLLGKTYDARKDLLAFYQERPDDKLNAFVLPYLGEMAFRQNEFAAAEKFFRDSVARYPNGKMHDASRLGLARALEKLNRQGDAEKIYSTLAAEKSSLSADSQFFLAGLQYSQGRYEEALDGFAKLEKDYPTFARMAQAKLGRGWTLLKMQRWDESVAVFDSIATNRQYGAESQYWAGLALKAKKDWGAASRKFLIAATKFPKNELTPALRYHAGDCLLQTGDVAGAKKMFAASLADAEGKPWQDYAAIGLIQTALAEKDFATADAAAEKFATDRPKSPLRFDAQRLAARSLLEQKRASEAVATLLKVAASGKEQREDSENAYLLAVAYEMQSKYKEALDALATVTANKGDRYYADAQWLKGTILVYQGRYGEAIEPLKAFLDSRPEGEAIVQAAGQLTLCYARSNRLEEAKRLYDELRADFAASPTFAALTEQLAKAALDANDVNYSAELSAWLASGEASVSGQGSGPATDWAVRGLMGFGGARLKAGDFERASAVFAQAMSKNPPAEIAAEAAYLRGQALQELGQYDSALAMYDEAIASNADGSNTPEALKASAELYERLGQTRRASEAYEKLVATYPNYAKRDAMMCAWAEALRKTGEAAHAERVLNRVREEYPQSAYASDAAYRLAANAFAKNDWAKAAELLREIPADGPHESLRESIAFLKAQVAMSKRDWAIAKKLFQSFVVEYADGENRRLAEFLAAECVYRQGNYEEALDSFDAVERKSLSRHDPWLANVALRRAQCLAQARKWSEARSVAVRMKKDYSDFEEQYEADYLIGRCYAAEGDYESARLAFTEVVHSPFGTKTETAGLAQWMIGDSFMQQENFEAALKELRKVEATTASHECRAGALLASAKCCERLDRELDATDIYEKIVKDYARTPQAEKAARRLGRLKIAAAESSR